MSSTVHPHAHLEDLADRIRPRVASSMLLWLILGFFALFVAWACLVKLDRTVHAAGRVIPSSRLQILSVQEGGTVQAILVRPGDLVKRGQVLVRLDPSGAGAELGSNQSAVASLTAKTARLEAEIAGRQPVYPRPTNTAEAEQIQVERSLHLARMSDLASQTAAATAREAQAQRAVAEAEATYQSRVSARDSAREQLDLIRPLVERGIEPRVSQIQLENQVATATSDAVQVQATIARARAQVAEAHATISQVREQWRAQAGTDLATAQAEMEARASTTPALADKLKRSTVVAPVDGRVNRVLVTTVGASIAPSQPIVEVVPSNDALTVEASVAPKDIAGIRFGQRARINVSAYESAIYGGIDGEVVGISPDATVDEKTGESHYTVRVRALSDLKDQAGRKLPIGPGMTADVNLLGDKRSVMSYILTPITRLQDSALRE